MSTFVRLSLALSLILTAAACAESDTTTSDNAQQRPNLTADYMACDAPLEVDIAAEAIDGFQMDKQPIWIAQPSPEVASQGMILLFHDKGETAQDWFQQDARASFVADALDAGLTVVALEQTSTGDTLQWRVHDSIDVLIEGGFMTEETPLYGMGHGEGGLYVSALTQTVPMNALVISGSEGVTPLIHSEQAVPHPATLFALGEQDTNITLNTVVQNAAAITDKATAEIHLRQSTPITPARLAQTTGIDCGLAQDVVRRMADASLLKADGTLAADPATTDWVEVLSAVEPMDMNDPADQALVQALAQGLDTLYAGSSFAVKSGIVLDFLAAH
ncbi:MAG: hypothetical protein AAFS10_05590 [Myxococcota bacterium]